MYHGPWRSDQLQQAKTYAIEYGYDIVHRKYDEKLTVTLPDGSATWQTCYVTRYAVGEEWLGLDITSQQFRYTADCTGVLNENWPEDIRISSSYTEEINDYVIRQLSSLTNQSCTVDNVLYDSDTYEDYIQMEYAEQDSYYVDMSSGEYAYINNVCVGTYDSDTWEITGPCAE